MLDETLVASIYVWDNEGVTYVGTGYPIRPNVLLTAQHVIARENQNNSEGIYISWPKCDQQDDEILEISDDIFLYDGEGQYDLVLLNCATPVLPKKNTPEIPFLFPSRNQVYECRGFPLAGEDETGHDVIPVPGRIIGGYYDEQLELVSDIAIQAEEDWGGLSGAPVFVDDELYGVVKIKYRGIEKYLYATSIPFLIQKSTAFQQALGLTQQAVAQKLTDQLHQTLVTHIEALLYDDNIPSIQLSHVLVLDRETSKAALARYLVQDLTAYESLNKLLSLSLQLEPRFKSKAKQWDEYLFDIEQLCGWLLLNSVNPSWWLKYGQALLKQSNDNLSTTISLEHAHYVEVIISRGLLQKAEFTLDTEKRQLVPAAHNALLFDASSEKASDSQILGRIFKDLRRADTAPTPVAELLEDIQATALNLYEARGKIIYYIIAQQHLEILQDRDWYETVEQKMTGYFQFISCDVSGAGKQQLSPSNHSQKALLEKVAAIMRLRNEKE